MDLYENLKYRVDLLDGEKFPRPLMPLLKIPEFREFKEGKTNRGTKFRHDIMKYIGFMYDPKSPFVGEYLDLDKRKMAVALECEFTPSAPRGHRFQPVYQEFMELSSEEARNMILAFLKDIHYSVWTEIQTTEQELWEITKLRWEPISTVKETVYKKTTGGGYSEEPETTRSSETDISDKDIFEAINKKEKLLDAAKKRRDHLKDLYEEMFADNVDIKEVAKEIPISPENAMSFV